MGMAAGAGRCAGMGTVAAITYGDGHDKKTLRRQGRAGIETTTTVGRRVGMETAAATRHGNDCSEQTWRHGHHMGTVVATGEAGAVSATTMEAAGTAKIGAASVAGAVATS
ncbi:unnamed protein product [Cuscuta epithymum]|uniref:Uncharacterized protein n=1 Tax=Cuscuta epithymum TaxID=186058 RepID=A0AAV0FWU4_9ASTE|nr:unnamed protein product [Cuscuta epithymum]